MTHKNTLMFRAHRSLVVQKQNFQPCFVLYTMRYAPPSIDRGTIIHGHLVFFLCFCTLHHRVNTNVSILFICISRENISIQRLSNHDFHSYYKFPQNIASAQNIKTMED